MLTSDIPRAGRAPGPPRVHDALQRAFARDERTHVPHGAEAEWLADLSTLFARDVSGELPLPRSVAERRDHPFLLAVAPLLQLAQSRLEAGIARVADRDRWAALRSPHLGPLLGEEMTHAVLNHVGRTMVLELHVARLQGRLSGASAEQRFRRFTDRFRRARTRAALFMEYPVLARVVADTLNRHVATRLELVERLAADRARLGAVLGGPGDDDDIVEARTVGDPHRGGRGVLLVRFRSGLDVVYKPRPLAVDEHFQALLVHLNARGWQPAFRTYRTVDRGEYGWTECLTRQPCLSAEEVARYYTRIGGYLALLHALGGTDVHFENLIAVGEHPMLIDMETLFHPALVGSSPDAGTARVNREIAASVLAVGLLPERTMLGAGGPVDLSGLGARGDQLSPVATPCWVAAGTDEMRLERRQMVMPSGDHEPALGAADERIDFTAHAPGIVAGFERMYRLLVEERRTLLAPDGPIAAFRDDPTRVILRPTHSYYVLLRESTHPDLLRGAVDRERHFDRLRAAASHDSLARVVAHERDDLGRGDIPLFTTRPSSRDLTSSAGERIADYLEHTGLQMVERRLHGMGASDLERQLWLVRASLATAIGSRSVSNAGTAPRLLAPRPLVGRTPVALATAVGDRLAASALVEHAHASWLGEAAARDGGSVIQPLGPDLYSGLSGVTLFLATLGDLTGDPRYTARARQGLQSLRDQVAARAGTAGLGGFTGWGGVVYTLSHLAVVLDEPALLREAEALADSLAPSIAADDQLDVVSGAAGFLLALAALHEITGSDRALVLARACGNRLVETARPAGPGVGWAMPGTDGPPLAGLSHGAAGIALALLKLSAITAEPLYRGTALAAIRYERSLFDIAAGTWPDLRPDTADAGGVNAWCHGAPGIGLARLSSLPALDDDGGREIACAVEATLAEGFDMNHSLCHGALGNLELPLAAARVFGRADWQARADAAVDRIAGQLAASGPICGSLGGLETPGFMTGLAGIGFGLLRIAHPRRVPSVLVLEPPPRRRTGAQ